MFSRSPLQGTVSYSVIGKWRGQKEKMEPWAVRAVIRNLGSKSWGMRAKGWCLVKGGGSSHLTLPLGSRALTSTCRGFLFWCDYFILLIVSTRNVFVLIEFYFKRILLSPGPITVPHIDHFHKTGLFFPHFRQERSQIYEQNLLNTLICSAPIFYVES